MCKSIGATMMIGRHVLESSSLRDMYRLLYTTYCSLAGLAVKSEPLERLRYHTSCPGLCIGTADLFPLQGRHQAISTTVSSTISVSNASLAPQKGHCTIEQCPLDISLEAQEGGGGGILGFRIPVVVDADDSGRVPAEDHIVCGTLPVEVFCSLVVHRLARQEPTVQVSQQDGHYLGARQESRKFRRGKELQGRTDLSQNATGLVRKTMIPQPI